MMMMTMMVGEWTPKRNRISREKRQTRERKGIRIIIFHFYPAPIFIHKDARTHKTRVILIFVFCLYVTDIKCI